MGVLVAAQVEAVDDVEHLAQEHAVLHVLVGVLEGGSHDGAAHGRLGCHLEVLERGEKGVVDEVEQAVGGHCLAVALVVRPVAPPAVLGNERAVVVFVELPVVLFLVVNFQEQHPCYLLDALGIAVDTGIVAHDVADILYKICQSHFNS